MSVSPKALLRWWMNVMRQHMTPRSHNKPTNVGQNSIVVTSINQCSTWRQVHLSLQYKPRATAEPVDNLALSFNHPRSLSDRPRRRPRLHLRRLNTQHQRD